jgi:predicted peptidase
MNRFKWLLILLLLPAICRSQKISFYEPRLFIRDGDTLPYRIALPENFDANKKYPLLLFLHGMGERGRDNQRQLIHGGKEFVDSATRKNFPAILLFPQCAATDFWPRIQVLQAPTDSTPLRLEYLTQSPPGPSLSLVMQLLDSFRTAKAVDRKRMYAMGISMGAMGTYELLWRKPHFFAAAVAICGGGNTEVVAGYAKRFPIWIFHGDADRTVPVDNSRKMAEALMAAGARVKYTEYPGVDHNSWAPAFADRELLPWLLEQKR